MVPGHPHQLLGTAGDSMASLGCEKMTLGSSWDASGAHFHTLSEPSGEPWSDPGTPSGTSGPLFSMFFSTCKNKSCFVKISIPPIVFAWFSASWGSYFGRRFRDLVF